MKFWILRARFVEISSAFFLVRVSVTLQPTLQMRSKSMAKELKGTVKEILGTAFSVGCTVAGKSPREVQTAIDNGEAVLPASYYFLISILNSEVIISIFICLSCIAVLLTARCCVGKPRTALTGPVVGG